MGRAPHLRAAGYLPLVAGCAAIFAVSSLPRPPIPELLEFWNSDKLLHALAYCVLGVLALFGAWVRVGALSRGARAEAVIVTSLYGLSDELHQSFVPGRSMSGADLVADVAGGLLGALVVGVAILRARDRAGAQPS